MISHIKRYIPHKSKVLTKRIYKDLRDSLLYAFVGKRPEPNYENIIFVCKGNVCRSTFAEQYLKKKQPFNINISSCGLDVESGGRSPDNAIMVAAEFGVEMANNVSKNINAMNIDKGALVIAMEFDQYKRLIQKYPHQKNNIFLLKDFLPWHKRFPCNIADPYGGEERDFRFCFLTIKDALDHMLSQIPDSRSL